MTPRGLRPAAADGWHGFLIQFSKSRPVAARLNRAPWIARSSRAMTIGGGTDLSTSLRAQRSNPFFLWRRDGLLRGACHRARIRATRWLAMTTKRTTSFPRRDAPEFCKIAALENRGRREDRVRAAPAVSCARCTRKCAHEHTGSAESIRPSLRNGFTAYNALSSATNSSCHRRPRIKTCPSPVGPT
jgi:hypothetical protein